MGLLQLPLPWSHMRAQLRLLCLSLLMRLWIRWPPPTPQWPPTPWHRNSRDLHRPWWALQLKWRSPWRVWRILGRLWQTLQICEVGWATSFENTHLQTMGFPFIVHHFWSFCTLVSGIFLKKMTTFSISAHLSKRMLFRGGLLGRWTSCYDSVHANPGWSWVHPRCQYRGGCPRTGHGATTAGGGWRRNKKLTKNWQTWQHFVLLGNEVIILQYIVYGYTGYIW